MSATNPLRAPRLFQLPPPPTHPNLRRRDGPTGLRAVQTPHEATSNPSPSLDDSNGNPLSDRSLLSSPPISSYSETPSNRSSATLTLERTPSLTPSLVPPAGPTEEEELSEAQLRQLYEEEEIDRFLHVFADVRV